ncbi:MAG TPA: RDD family protein [Rickettsiales bacterium]|nr:RDD family protein [Rickettsiales bacterium]
MDKIKTFISETKQIEKIYASPLKRLGSFIIDSIIIIVLCNVFLGIAKYYGMNTNIYKQEAIVENQDTENEQITTKQVIDKDNFSRVYIIILSISSLYFMIFLSSKKQATVGNQVFKIMVIHTKKAKLNPLNAFVRYIATVLNNTIYGIGYLTYFFKKDRAFLQDMLSDTRVINLKEEK